MDNKVTPKKYITIAGILVSLFLCTLLITNFFGLLHFQNRTNSLWLSRIEFWVITFLMYLFAVTVEKTDFLIWKEQKQKPLFYLLSTITTIGFIFLLLTTISIIQRFVGHNANNEVLNEVNNIGDKNLALFIFTALTAGITEELIFRGYLLPRLQFLINNKWAAIFISSLFFGLAHFTYNDITRMLFPFIIGIVFSIHYSKYKSLIALIICHIIIDLILI